MQHQHLCDSVTGAAVLCTRLGPREIDGYHFCGQHFRIYNEAKENNGGVARPLERCRMITRRNYCPHDCVVGESVCQRHIINDEFEEDIVWERMEEPNPDDIAAILERMQARFQGLHPPPEEPPAFADDSQNVHRKEVSEQSNKATQFLFSLKAPDTQMTEKEISMKFVEMVEPRAFVFATYLDVMNDIHHWFHLKDCRQPGDRFYFRVMRNLVFYIKNSEHADELWKRLQQECVESLGMCCDGHISRLCNVLAGFVEGVNPPVSLGELMQQKMAAIAGQDIPEADKKRQANEFFEQHGVPQVERLPWLDAF